MANRQRLTAIRATSTRLCAGENKGIKTPQKLEDYVKNAHKEPVNLKRDNSKEL